MTIMLRFIVIFIFSITFLTFSEEVYRDTSIQQILIILVDNSETEIFLNDTSLGYATRIDLKLPVGKYKIKGKRDLYFEDNETEHIFENTPAVVTIGPRRLKFAANVMAGIFYSKVDNYPRYRNGIILDFGIHFLKSNIGLYGISFFDSDYIGIKYSYTFLRKNAIDMNVAIAPLLFSENDDYGNLEHSFGFLNSITNNIGNDHFKFTQSFSMIFSNPVMFSFGLGFRIAF